MKKPVFSRFLASLNKSHLVVAAVAASAVLASPVARASGGDDGCEDMACNSFFIPEIINRPSEMPFFRSYHTFYGGHFDEAGVTVDSIAASNLNEWFAQLSGTLDEKLVGQLIYKMNRGQVVAIGQALAGTKVTLNADQQAIVKGLSKISNAKALVAYVVFSKDVEPLVTRRLSDDSWSYDVPKTSPADIAAAAKLIASGKAALASAKGAFLQERYKLQIERLMFYSGRYADAEAFFTANISSIKSAGTVKHRMIDTGAGAFYKQKKYAMANYLYSLNFDTYEPLKQASWFSFHPQEQADWQQSIALAKTTRQKEVLWQMFGISADGTVAIQKIYGLNPKSELLALLLAREVNIAEENVIVVDDTNANAGEDKYLADQRAKGKVIGQQRLALIKSITDQGKVVRPELWNLATAHLLAISGDTAGMKKYLAQAEKLGLSSLEKQQARTTALMAVVQATSSIDKSKENYLGTELAWLKSVATDGYDEQIPSRLYNLQTYVLGHLSATYAKGGDAITALLLKDESTSAVYQDNAKIAQILALQAKANKTPFEKALVGNFQLKSSDLKEVQAINLMFAGQFAQAAKLFATLPKENNANLGADPFLIHIVDCHDCDQSKPPVPGLTKAQFNAKMAQLQIQAKQPGTVGAAASFAFANGLYNISYYGNSRTAYYTTDSNFSSGPAKKILNNKVALAFYDRAMTLAPTPEAAAKAAFMAAKTEQNEFYNTQKLKSDWYEDENGAPHSPKYFGLLKAKYANTKYYQEIIKECGEFRTYLKQNP